MAAFLRSPKAKSCILSCCGFFIQASAADSAQAGRTGGLMPFIPGMIVGGQLLIAVVDRVPEVNFSPTCRQSSQEALAINDHFDDCIKDETRARDELAMHWSEFDAADRARCSRTATAEPTSSYVELLTCLEMEQRAKTLRVGTPKAVIMELPEPAPDREREKPDLQVYPGRTVRHLPRPVAVAARPPAPPAGLFSALCQSGLRAILPVCW
jgi:hypothetical protein